MIRRIEIENFRGVRKMAVDLREFQVLVGANGSGKSSLLDALAFVGDFMRDGLDAAFAARTNNPETLFFKKESGYMRICVEFSPDAFDESLTVLPQNAVWRYQMVLFHFGASAYELQAESLLVFDGTEATRALTLGHAPFLRDNAIESDMVAFARTIFERAEGILWVEEDRLGGKDSNNVPFQDQRSAIWFLRSPELSLSKPLRDYLTSKIRRYELVGESLKKASPPGKDKLVRSDGSSLPWQAAELQRASPDDFDAWIRHVNTALPNLESVRVVEREDDRYAYLMLRWRNGLELPSWSASEGTLRLLALTILGYHPTWGELIMVEEPENGIHPQAIETIVQALKYSIGNQVLITSHSPMVINTVLPEDLLCFASSANNGVTAIAGNVHPRLLNWKKSVSLGNIFATGILAIQS